MIFELAQDFSDALAAMPEEHPKRRLLELLEEAIRRDICFIDRRPTALFQCMWNTCWWYDCPEAAGHCNEPEGGWQEPPPWEQPGSKLHVMLERWRQAKESRTAGALWLRSLRPPPTRLGRGSTSEWAPTESRVRASIPRLTGSETSSLRPSPWAYA